TRPASMSGCRIVARRGAAGGGGGGGGADGLTGAGLTSSGCHGENTGSEWPLIDRRIAKYTTDSTSAASDMMTHIGRPWPSRLVRTGTPSQRGDNPFSTSP